MMMFVKEGLIGFIVVEIVGILPIIFYFLLPKEDTEFEVRKQVFRLAFRSVIAMILGFILFFAIEDTRKVILIVIVIQVFNWLLFHHRK